MNKMTEFMSRETIKEKIDEISEKFFEFKIVNDGVHKEVEDDMQLLIETLSTEISKRGELDDQWPRVVAYLLDTIIAQLIVTKLQNAFILELKNDE